MDIYGNKLVNTTETTLLHISCQTWQTCIERMDIHGNKLVNTMETLPLWIYLSNLADMLTTVRG